MTGKSDRELCQVAAVVPAAGAGRRMNAGRGKALLSLAGVPILLRSVAPLIDSVWLDVLVVVARTEELEEIADLLAARCPPALPAAVVPGGADRSASVRAGLEWLASWSGWHPEARHLAAVHDAARPLLSAELWKRVLLAALDRGAAVPGLPLTDSLKRVDRDGLVQSTVDREGLWQVQTPQVFPFEELLAAHRRARRDGPVATDDAQVWEEAGRPVTVVPGERDNIKITTAADLRLAEAVLKQRGEEGADRPGI